MNVTHLQKGQQVHIIHGIFKGYIIRIEAWGENPFAKSSMSKGFVCGKINGIWETICQSDLGEIVHVGDNSSWIELQYYNTCQKHKDYYLEKLVGIDLPQSLELQKIVIKSATKKDAQNFFRLEAKCFDMKEDSDSIYFWVPMLIHQFCYKAVIGTKIIGGIIAMSTKKKNTWYINSLFIDPEYRRKAIASSLLEKIFDVADGNDIVLDINPQKTHLFTIYGNHGFVKKSVSKNHYRDGEDRVMLERKTTKKELGSAEDNHVPQG